MWFIKDLIICYFPKLEHAHCLYVFEIKSLFVFSTKCLTARKETVAFSLL